MNRNFLAQWARLALVATAVYAAFTFLKRDTTRQADASQEHLSMPAGYEGRVVWEAIGVAYGEIEPMIGRMAEQGRYFLLLYMDSLSCMSCFAFHVESIGALQAAFNVPIIIVADSQYAKFIGRDMRVTGTVVVAPSHRRGFVVLMVDSSGKITHANVADPNAYTESKTFYQTIERLLMMAGP